MFGRRLFSGASAFFALLLLAGCAEPAVFSKIFQLEKDQKLYTKYNIWYTDPQNISCLNIQQGAYIPVGTEIEPVRTSAGWNDRIVFRDAATRREYTIVFDVGYRLCSLDDYIAYTFTTESRDQLLADMPENVKARILRGICVPGMTQAQVLLAFGPPPAIRTPDRRNESWIYWLSPDKTFRLVFRGDKIQSILNINEK